MPRKFIQRWSPDPKSIRENSRLRFLGEILYNPELFHLTRRSVSVAFFVGFLICFFPLPIGHIFLAAFAAVYFRCNLPITFVVVMISNPLTFAFIYYYAYLAGSWILQSPPSEFEFELSWNWAKGFFKEAWLPIVIGNIAFGIVSSIGSYALIQGIWRWSVNHRWKKRKLR